MDEEDKNLIIPKNEIETYHELLRKREDHINSKERDEDCKETTDCKCYYCILKKLDEKIQFIQDRHSDMIKSYLDKLDETVQSRVSELEEFKAFNEKTSKKEYKRLYKDFMDSYRMAQSIWKLCSKIKKEMKDSKLV